MNVVLNTSYFHPESFLLYHGPPEKYEFGPADILLRFDSAQDNSLGIQMRFHSWTYAGGDNPKQIIYITNHSNLTYAFPFYDENYYADHGDLIENEELRREMKKMVSLERHLNYIISQLGWNDMHIPKNKENVNRLITLLTHNLLHLKEYTAPDTATLRKNLMADLEDSKLFKNIGPEKYIKTLNRMVTDGLNKNTRFFNTKDGLWGVWKFNIDDSVGHKPRVIISFENQEYYTVVHL